MANKKYRLFCPHCTNEVENLSVGENSYLECTCSKCSSEFFAKTTKDGIKTKLLHVKNIQKNSYNSAIL